MTTPHPHADLLRARNAPLYDPRDVAFPAAPLMFNGLTAAAPAAQGDALDAARYRRLRECNSGSLVVAQITGTGEEDWQVLTERDADEAIDAEINAARAAKEGNPQ